MNYYTVKEVKYVLGSFYENVLFVTGDVREANMFADEYRKKYCRGDRGTHDVTVIDSRTKEYIDRIDEYGKTLTDEQKKETVVIDGKLYAKWVLDFKAKEEGR